LKATTNHIPQFLNTDLKVNLHLSIYTRLDLFINHNVATACEDVGQKRRRTI